MTTRSMEQKHTAIKILMTAKRMKILGGLYLVLTIFFLILLVLVKHMLQYCFIMIYWYF